MAGYSRQKMRFRSFLLCFFIASSEYVGTTAERAFRFSFDETVPAEIQIDTRVAGLTFSPDEVIQGRGSLLCDTRTGFEEWYEFLVTTPAVHFEPGGRYSVSFLYRVLGNVSGNFFCLLRPRSGESEGPASPRMFAPWWTGERGDEGRRKAEFIIPGEGDYMLVVGIQKRAALVIDDLEIKEIAPADHRRFIPTLRRGRSLSHSSLNRIRELNERYKLDQVLEENLVAVSLPPMSRERAAMVTIEGLTLDIVLGTTEPVFSSGHGIRTIGIAPPYATLHWRWTPASIWEKRIDLFVDKGFLLPLSGDVYPAGDEYPMCVNAGFWSGLHRNAALALLQQCEGLVQPGLGGAFGQDAAECFCGSCNERFQEWLRSLYSSRELRDWGIRDVDQFSVRTYRLRGRRDGEALLSDLVLREWIRWKYFSHLSRWAEFVEAMKEEGSRRLTGIPVGASPGVGGATNPYVVAAAPFHDFWLVSCADGPQQSYRELTEIPLWIGSGLRGTRVWVTGHNVDDLRDGKPEHVDPEEKAALFAGAMALGALPVFSGLGAPAEVMVPNGSRVDEKEMVEKVNLLREMILRFRSLYAYRRSYHNVAVVYSIPSLMWSVPTEKQPHHYQAFVRTCRMLRNGNIPFDVLVFDHLLMFPESERLREAGKYDAIVLPGVDCMSAGQVAMLTEFGAKKGSIYADGPCARFDENYSPRLRPGIEGIEVRSMSDAENALEDLRRLAWVGIPRVGPGLLASAWRSLGGRMYALHLAVLPEEAKAGTLPSSLRVSMRLPSSFVPETAVFLTPENLEGTRVEVSKDSSGALVTEMPCPSSYGVLVYARGGYLEKASSDLIARRKTDRERVKENARARGEKLLPGEHDSALGSSEGS